MSSFPRPENKQCQYKYDVFLSFRGEDTRKNFVDHLHDALRRKGIVAFKDDDDQDLPRGKCIKSEILGAMEKSRYVLVIFSENYASSTWCLEEVANAVECKDIKKGLVIPIFYKVSPSDIRKLRGNFGRDFAETEKTYTGDKADIKRWKDALRKVVNLAGRELKDGHETRFIEQIMRELENRVGPQLSYVVGDLVGMHSHVANVVEYLCLNESDVRSIGIWGMGGIGKTTVAQAVFDKIQGQFDDGCCFLANVREISKKNGLVYLQNQFLGDILQQDNLRIRDDQRGANMIKEKLRHKKVLIILDDVDEKEQLEKLAGHLDWFGRGSRIIITTRDEHLLLQYGVNSIFRVEGLSFDEARQLFCLKAFRSNYPPAEFKELTKQVIEYAGGLPLVLDVLGSFLAYRSLKQWRSSLARLKECPEGKIFDRLKISYDGLQQKEKEIFLDIACYFKGKEKPYVTEVLDNCGLYADIGIEVLVNRALIQIVNNTMWMHDLLQEMAWEIVRQESPGEPGERSRVWLFEDVCHILSKNLGTGKVKVIVLQSGNYRTVHLNGESFTNMTNLRILDVRAIHLSSGFNHLSNELRLLRWDNCSIKSFPPSFLPKNLVELHMRDSRLCSLWKWEKMQVLEKLKVINLSGSKSFVESPNFIYVPNLERLILKGCKALSQVHPSIGYLERLNLLDLCDCENLMGLPDSIGNLKALRVLNLFGCSNLEELPESIRALECLDELDISESGITHLPSSLTFLQNLKKLRLHVSKRRPQNVAKLAAKGYELSYVPPFFVDDRPVVNLTREVLHAADPKWNEYLVGYFLEKMLPFQLTEQALKNTWGPKLVDVLADDQGFFFFHVPNPIFRRKILEEGPFFIARIPLILQQWKPLMELKKDKQSFVPVWIRLKNLPLDLWSAPAISAIASSIGKPLYVDQRTEAMRMISFARVCVEIQANQPRVSAVDVNVAGVSRSIAIEFEWRPVECIKCGVFGHKCDVASLPSRPSTSPVQTQAAPASSTPALAFALVPVDLAAPEQAWKQVKGKRKRPSAPVDVSSTFLLNSSEEGRSLKLKTAAMEKRLPMTFSRKAPRGPLIISEQVVAAPASTDEIANPSKALDPMLPGLEEGAGDPDNLISSLDDDLLSPCPSSKAAVADRRMVSIQDKLLALALDPSPLMARPAPPSIRQSSSKRR